MDGWILETLVAKISNVWYQWTPTAHEQILAIFLIWSRIQDCGLLNLFLHKVGFLS